ncbi:hypothetical protein FBU30_001241 [Linnemannia zychae]|nr:hypothetical protein FBU30_001241 [Linnemannia zychae]
MNPDGNDGNDGLKQHLELLRDKLFDFKEWYGKSYVFLGAIRMNDRLLQLLAFKIKELQSIRYCRVPKDKSPNPLVTSIGVTDVTNLLPSDPSQVAVLSLDLGTSCLLGATVTLPPGQTPATLNWLDNHKENNRGASSGRTIKELESTLPPLKDEGAPFCKHVLVYRECEDDLDDFYNKTDIWKHQWDAQICRKEEFYKVAEGLLNMVGGSVGRPILV